MRQKVFSIVALLLMAVTQGAWADGTYTVQFKANGNTVTKEDVTLPVTYKCSYAEANGELDLILKQLYGWTGPQTQTFCTQDPLSSTDPSNVTVGKDRYDPYIIINNAFEGTVTVSGAYKVYLTTTNYSVEISVAASATKFDLTKADGSEAHGTVTFTVGGKDATQAKKDDEVTVSVTPAEGYSTKDVTVRAYTTWDAALARAKSRAAAPELKDDIDVTKNETEGTWTFTMPEANVWVTVSYTKDLQDSWIQTIADQTYTGSDIEPTVTVKDGSTTLTAGTDYTVSYRNNKDAGTATVTVTAVEGSGYSGTATATFTIKKADITMTTAPAAVEGMVYSGSAMTLITVGTASFGTVLYSLDGTTYAEALPQATAAGTYTVYYKVEGDANHNAFDVQTVTATISAKTLTTTTMTVEVAEGAAGEVPAITVKDGDVTLTEGTDYDIVYKDAEDNELTKEEVEAAMATATADATYTAVIILKGNYSGTVQQTVTVKAAAVATVTIAPQSYVTYYAAKDLSLDDAAVKLYTIAAVDGSAATVTLSSELASAKAETPLLIFNGTDAEQQVVLKVNENADEVTFTSEFKGTLAAQAMPARCASCPTARPPASAP